MMTNRKRFLIVIASVTAGTFLSALLFYSRRGKLGPGEFGTLFINMIIALALVIGIGIMFRKKKDD